MGQNYESSIVNLNDSSTLSHGWYSLTNLQAINLEAVTNIEYHDDWFCHLTQLIYCNKMTNNTFGNTFYMLNNALAPLVLYFNPDLYYVSNYFE